MITFHYFSQLLSSQNARRKLACSQTFFFFLFSLQFGECTCFARVQQQAWSTNMSGIYFIGVLDDLLRENIGSVNRLRLYM